MPSSPLRVALIRCHDLPEPDPDEAALLRALRDSGHDAAPLSWDPPAGFEQPDPDSFDALIVRATWNYWDHPEAFRAWLRRDEVRQRLWNPAPVIEWNMHKRYLLDLENEGVPIVPTAFIDRCEASEAPSRLAGVLEERCWRDVVLKPAVSGGSLLTRRFSDGRGPEASAFLGSWISGRDAMVQPYLRSVENTGGMRGERAIVWIGGCITHVIERRVRFEGDDQDPSGRAAATDEERAFAGRVLAAADRVVGEPLLFARIDVMDGDDGSMLLSELELIEPSLYFDLGEGSAGAFTEAVGRLG